MPFALVWPLAIWAAGCVVSLGWLAARGMRAERPPGWALLTAVAATWTGVAVLLWLTRLARDARAAPVGIDGTQDAFGDVAAFGLLTVATLLAAWSRRSNESTRRAAGILLAIVALLWGALAALALLG